MTIPHELTQVLKRIENGDHTAADIAALRQRLTGETRQLVYQLDGKYNVNISQGENIQIGDRTYVSWSDDAVQALIQAIRAAQDESWGEPLQSAHQCQERDALNQYLQATLDRLKQQGCLDIRQNVTVASQTSSYVARIVDFELPFGPIKSRGEAFFFFSEFDSIQMPILQRFSGQCLQWARAQVNPRAAGQAFYNFRMPTHLCFTIALVDQLKADTRTAIQTTNPFDNRVDLLWYEVPLVCELSQRSLQFYNRPTTIWEQFKGEVAWHQIRPVIQRLLSPSDAGW